MERTEQTTLKSRLKLKRLSIDIEEAVEDNFGYCPRYEWFNELLDERGRLSEQVKKSDPEWHSKFEKTCDTNNIKRLNIYL